MMKIILTKEFYFEIGKSVVQENTVNHIIVHSVISFNFIFKDQTFSGNKKSVSPSYQLGT